MGRHVNSAGAGGGEKRISGGIILQKKALGWASFRVLTRPALGAISHSGRLRARPPSSHMSRGADSPPCQLVTIGRRR